MIKQGWTQVSEETRDRGADAVPEVDGGRSERAGDQRRRLGAIGGWAVLLVMLFIALLGNLAATGRAFATHKIVTAEGRSALDILSRPMPRGASADAYEAYSELVLAADPLATDLAALASEQVLERDSARPFVWARLAYSLSQSATAGGEPLPDRAVEALGRSMELCPVCSPDLVRWRFSFVLAHWSDIPDSLRRQAFRDSELLRRSGEDAEFFADLRAMARREGIPFDAYREDAARASAGRRQVSDPPQAVAPG
ncbi:MAG: hypothetical protein KGS00_08555 [Alphaproteobacteria bacterium]|nr:hypothetical protein [Alphaproteobacteria bacterium]